MISVWDTPDVWFLVSPMGTLALNTLSGDRYMLDPAGCTVSKPMRSTVDNIPQGDGEIFHRRFTGGYAVTLKIEMWVDDNPACDADLVRMTDTLMLHLNALLNTEDGRLIWTPPGAATRMFTNLQWLTFPDQEHGGIFTVGLDTPFPYAIDFTQTTPQLGTTITNAGTADFYPVIHVDGPSTAFLLTNIALGVSIVYDSARPGGVALGGSDYAEIDTFKNTIVLNGDVQDLDAGIDPNLSTFWWLPPGDSDTLITGATGYVLMNNAWA